MRTTGELNGYIWIERLDTLDELRTREGQGYNQAMGYRNRRERVDAWMLPLLVATGIFIVVGAVVGFVIECAGSDSGPMATLLFVGTILWFVVSLIGAIFGTPGSE